MIDLIHKYLFLSAATIFIFQAVFLFARGRNNRVRLSMAVQELAWGVMYLVTLVMMHKIYPDNEYALFREKVLVLGSYFISFMLIFLTQVLLPGWLNWKRFFLLESPILFMTIVYYAGMSFLGDSPEYLFSYAMIFDSVGHFNVWFRFVFWVVDIVYIVAMLRWLRGYEKKYDQWKNDNFSDQEYVDIAWMRAYIYIIVGISFFYFAGLLIGGRILLFCHCLFAVVSFSYLFYKILFYESPYPQDFFATLDEKRQKDESDEFYVISNLSEEEQNLSESSFDVRMPEYINLLKQWMTDEKPYLYKDFKLTDVSRVLPLNRSYLSRIFNEGFGRNFNEVVRNYRVEYSKSVLYKQPSLPLYRVAELSGFSSDSTYIRAFKMITGVTPTQYRNELEQKLHS